MSYYSMHQLTWDTPEPSQETIVQRLSALMNLPEEQTASIALQHDSAKWYDADQHVATLSREWPKTILSLDCQGENGEKSITSFRNGLNLYKEHEASVFNKQEFQERATPVPQT